MSEEEKQEIEEEIPDDTPDSNFSKVDNGSYNLPVIEIYKNDFENYEPYVPNSGETEEEDEEEKDTDETTDETTEEEETEDSEEIEEKDFDWQLGEILETYYYNKFSSIDYEQDYTEISSSASINIPMQVDLLRFWKGVQGKLFCGWFKLNQKVEMEDIPLINAIFIEDLTFKEEGTDLSLKGGDVLLEEKYEFDFHQMKRSAILKEMIKTAGLEPAVDPTGLIDDVIDYTNVKSSDSGGSGDDTDAPDIETMVKNAIKGKKGDRAKAEAIYSAMVNHITYSYYSCTKYANPNDAWKAGAINCADSANVGCVAYRKAGLSAQVVHGPNHFWCEVQISGSTVASDVTGAEGSHCVRSLGEVWDGLSKDSDCGDRASC